MSESGSEKSLAERLREKSEESNKAYLQVQAEALESFRQRLESSLKSELTITESAIRSESQALRLSVSRLYQLSLKNPLLIGLSIILAVTIGTWGLSWYLSSNIKSQLEQMKRNETLLQQQTEGLNKGAFYKLPSGKVLVRVEKDSEKELDDGNSWAIMVTH